MTWPAILLVGSGSSVGAVARYAIGQGIGKVNNRELPWSTWVVNMVGTFLLGIFSEEFAVIHHDPNWWLLLGIGFCGSFTTFSTMSVEMVHLFRRHLLLGLVYLGSSLALGLLLAWLPQWWF